MEIAILVNLNLYIYSEKNKSWDIEKIILDDFEVIGQRPNAQRSNVDSDLSQYGSQAIDLRVRMDQEAAENAALQKEFDFYMKQPILASDLHGNTFIGSRNDYNNTINAQKIAYGEQFRNTVLTPTGTIAYYVSGMNSETAMQWGRLDVSSAAMIKGLRGTSSSQPNKPLNVGKAHVIQPKLNINASFSKVEIGTKLEYPFGKATGSLHNIERSTGMLKQLESVGIFDNSTGRNLLNNHLTKTYNNNIGMLQSNGRCFRESLLIGPNGILKVESVWEKNKLITITLFGGK